jgi:hypothetical protein
MAGHKDFEHRLELVERGVRAIEGAEDAGLRASAQSLVQAVLELHRAGLERLLEVVHEREAGQGIIDDLGRDPMVGKLLLLHSLHPLTLEARVAAAIESLRTSLHAEQGAVDVVSMTDGVVRVRVVGGNGLKGRVEAALLDAAPDMAGLDVEDGGDASVVAFVSMASLRGTDPARYER